MVSVFLFRFYNFLEADCYVQDIGDDSSSENEQGCVPLPFYVDAIGALPSQKSRCVAVKRSPGTTPKATSRKKRTIGARV